MIELTPAEQIVRDALGETDAHTYNGTPHDLEALARRTAARLRDLARAATPADDRGRELAEKLLIFADGLIDDMAEHLCTQVGVKRRQLDEFRTAARALAAPAETEAGDAPAVFLVKMAIATHTPGWVLGTHATEAGAWAQIADMCQRSGINPTTYEVARHEVQGATTPPAPEGEADELPAPLGDLASWLRAAAAGRREYAEKAPEDQATVLHIEAATLDGAVRLAEGDPAPMYGWLPSWREGEVWSADLPVEAIDRNRHGLPVYSGEDWTVEADPAGNVSVFVSDDSHPGAGSAYVFEPDVVAAIAAARRDPAPAPAGPQAEGAGETAPSHVDEDGSAMWSVAGGWQLSAGTVSGQVRVDLSGRASTGLVPDPRALARALDASAAWSGAGDAPGATYTCPCGTVPEPCPGPEDRPLCMRGAGSIDPLVVTAPCGTCGHAQAVHHKLRCEHPRCDYCNGWTPQAESASETTGGGA